MWLVATRRLTLRPAGIFTTARNFYRQNGRVEGPDMNSADNEWGFLATLLALLMIIAIFGSALWFIFSASLSNKKFRWLQIVDRRNRQQRSKAPRR